MIKHILISLSAFFLLSESALAAGYLKIGDIKGEAADAAHKDWIIIESFSTAMARPSTSQTGSTRQRGAVADNFVVSKSIDRASPELAQALTRGHVFPSIIIEHQIGQRKYTVTLSNARITSIAQSGQADEPPTEEVSFAYNKITWTYKSGGKSTTASWDMKTGR